MFLGKQIFLSSSWRLKRFQESSPFTRGCRKILPSCQQTTLRRFSGLLSTQHLAISYGWAWGSLAPMKSGSLAPLWMCRLAVSPTSISLISLYSDHPSQNAPTSFQTVLHGFYQCLATEIKTRPHRLGQNSFPLLDSENQIHLGPPKTICQLHKYFSLIASLQDCDSLPAGACFFRPARAWPKVPYRLETSQDPPNSNKVAIQKCWQGM